MPAARGRSICQPAMPHIWTDLTAGKLQFFLIQQIDSKLLEIWRKIVNTKFAVTAPHFWFKHIYYSPQLNLNLNLNS